MLRMRMIRGGVACRFSRSFSQLVLRDGGDCGVALATSANVAAGDLVLSSPVPSEEIGSSSKQGKRSMQIGKHVHWDIRGQTTASQKTPQHYHFRGQTSPHVIKYAFHANDPNCRLDVVTLAGGSGDTWILAAEEDFSALASNGQLFVNVYARRDISSGGLLTYNFNSFEEKLSEGFTCKFSHKDIKGFEFLDADEKKALFDAGIAFPHIAAQAQNAKQVGLKENGEFGKALATLQPLKNGDIAVINYIQPHELVGVEKKDMHSIQIGKDTHWNNAHPQHLIKMGQHAYDPSCRVSIMTYEEHDTTRKLVMAREDQYLVCAEKSQLFIALHARRDLNPGDLLTYNYNSFEDHIQCTFTDMDTGKLVGGFPKCDGEERTFLLKSGIALPHIRRMADRGWLFEGSRPVHV